jgi:hypothetical protein
MSDGGLLKIVNASGFAFQLAVEDAIRRPEVTHQWRVEAREMPWAESEGGGFADLVLTKGRVLALIECKRTSQDARWAFLVSSGQRRWEEEYADRCQWLQALNGRERGGWFDWRLTPESDTSGFCAVRGGGERDAPMLERICQRLLRAQDVIATRWLRTSARGLLLPIPVIVTNATLSVCRFDPAEVPLETGAVAKLDHRSVPLVRFRKPLAMTEEGSHPDSLAMMAQESERTVFVVNSGSLLEVLRNFGYGPAPEWADPVPWNVAWPENERG